MLNGGGLTIRTTLDPAMQAAADRAVKRYVHASDHPVAAEALAEPGTGAIRAMAASRPYGRSKARNEISYNVVADAGHGGGAELPGGLHVQDLHPDHRAEAGHEDRRRTERGGAGYRAPGPAAFRNCAGENVGDPGHTVTNDEGSPGWKTLRTGTWSSVNTFFMELERRVGLCETVTTAEDLGIRRADGRPLSEYETFTLGIGEMDPVTVAERVRGHRGTRPLLRADGDHPDHRPRRRGHRLPAEVPSGAGARRR
ncbi:hypothetical protein ACFSTC_13365 [Nonomuraea ferruginea]